MTTRGDRTWTRKPPRPPSSGQRFRLIAVALVTAGWIGFLVWLILTKG